MKFEIEGQKYDTSKMTRIEIRTIISKIKFRLARGEEAYLESIRNLDGKMKEKVEKAKISLLDLLNRLQKIYK